MGNGNNRSYRWVTGVSKSGWGCHRIMRKCICEMWYKCRHKSRTINCLYCLSLVNWESVRRSNEKGGREKNEMVLVFCIMV